MLKVWSLLVALVVCGNARLSHFALIYNGQCVQNSQTQSQCQGKANSQTIAAYIDPNEGVQFQDTQQEEGPYSSLTVTILGQQSGYVAHGDIQFGYDPNQQVQSTLTFVYDQNDVTEISDPNSNRFISAGFFNITGGTGAYAKAVGLISLNTNGQYNSQNQQSDWYAFLEASIGTPQ
ncbi:hypothetical protein RFI_10441 [Reticulomyxa filosa]|uniref:Uncharacterized protein n=1 Tax=Reticulomyxa filosa TaxID=46433 RepID=X6NK48_RETFI|nr:hypothetical protein RFI_10441 [Reticulomyxa filosa]|eukprot:ETO26690.1 hypothetical protein RFI_10441 [Reticulomyxa filosa]